MTKRHVIYCDHCLDSVVEAGSNARERKPATVSHEIALQQRAKVVIEGIITDSDWLKSTLIAFLANQNGRKYQNKLKESDFWES